MTHYAYYMNSQFCLIWIVSQTLRIARCVSIAYSVQRAVRCVTISKASMMCYVAHHTDFENAEAARVPNVHILMG